MEPIIKAKGYVSHGWLVTASFLGDVWSLRKRVGRPLSINVASNVASLDVQREKPQRSTSEAIWTLLWASFAVGTSGKKLTSGDQVSYLLFLQSAVFKMGELAEPVMFHIMP